MGSRERDILRAAWRRVFAHWPWTELRSVVIHARFGAEVAHDALSAPAGTPPPSDHEPWPAATCRRALLAALADAGGQATAGWLLERVRLANPHMLRHTANEPKLLLVLSHMKAAGLVVCQSGQFVLTVDGQEVAG